MKTFQNYIGPSTADLARLKDQLGYTGAQMADLASVAGSNQWRKYTGGAAPRELNPHMLFFIAARLELGGDVFNCILDRMRGIGASFEFDEPEGASERPE